MYVYNLAQQNCCGKVREEKRKREEKKRIRKRIEYSESSQQHDREAETIYKMYILNIL